MFNDVILSLLLFFPFMAALLAFLIPSGAKGAFKNFALYITVINLSVFRWEVYHSPEPIFN